MREFKLSGKMRPTMKPDNDNIAKSVLDALNGLAYVDDKQIVELKVSCVPCFFPLPLFGWSGLYRVPAWSGFCFSPTPTWPLRPLPASRRAPRSVPWTPRS